MLAQQKTGCLQKNFARGKQITRCFFILLSKSVEPQEPSELTPSHNTIRLPVKSSAHTKQSALCDHMLLISQTRQTMLVCLLATGCLLIMNRLLAHHEQVACSPRTGCLLTTNRLLAHHKQVACSSRTGCLLTTNRLLAHHKQVACSPRTGCLLTTNRLLAHHEQVACSPQTGCLLTTNRLLAHHKQVACSPQTGCLLTTNRLLAGNPVTSTNIWLRSCVPIETRNSLTPLHAGDATVRRL